MKKILLTLTLIFAFSGFSFAKDITSQFVGELTTSFCTPDIITVSGQVTDTFNNPLGFVHMYLITRDTNQVVCKTDTTNSFGHYSFMGFTSPYTVEAMKKGYQTRAFPIDPFDDTTVNFVLTEQ